MACEDTCFNRCARIFLYAKADLHKLLRAMDEDGYLLGRISLSTGATLPYRTLILPFGAFSHVAFDALDFEARIWGNLVSAAKQLERCCVTYVLPEFYTDPDTLRIWAWSGVDVHGKPRMAEAYSSVQEMHRFQSINS